MKCSIQQNYSLHNIAGLCYTCTCCSATCYRPIAANVINITLSMLPFWRIKVGVVMGQYVRVNMSAALLQALETAQQLRVGSSYMYAR